MERVVSFTTFEQEEASNPALEYWLTRTHEERIAEGERLRREYIALLGESHDECRARFRGLLRFVEREAR